jgi:hypothetical protein
MFLRFAVHRRSVAIPDFKVETPYMPIFSLQIWAKSGKKPKKAVFLCFFIEKALIIRKFTLYLHVVLQ